MNDRAEKLLAALRSFRDQGPVVVDETDSRRDIADVVDTMTWAAFRADPELGSGHSPDGFALYTVEFRDREVFITGGMWTIAQDLLPCEVELWVDDAITKMTSFDIRIGATPGGELDVMRQLLSGSIQWHVEYSWCDTITDTPPPRN